MAFASLTIDLIARIANIESNMGKAAQIAERNAQRIDRAFAAVGTTLGGLGAALSVGGFAGFIKSAINTEDEIVKLSQKIGISVENLAGYKHAADLSGLSTEQFATGAKQLNKAISEGNPYLSTLGITATEANGALIQLADSFQAMPDGAQKTAIAMQLMGKSGSDMIPLLNGGGAALRQMLDEGRKFNPITQESAKLAEAFNDNLTRIQASAGQAGFRIANALLPTLNDAATAFNQTESATTGTWNALSRFGTVGQTLAVLGANVEFVFKGMGRELGGLAAQAAAFFSGDFAGASRIGEEMRRDAATARAAFDIYEKGLLGLGNGFKQAAGEATKAGKAIQDSGLGGDARIITDDEAERIQSALRKAFDIKPLDDYVNEFARRGDQIRQEYAKLRAELEPGSGGGTGADVNEALQKARSAFQGGDSTTAGVQLSRAKSALRSLADQGAPGFETAYLSRQLEAFELAMNDAAKRTAETTRDLLQKNLEQARVDVSRIDPIHIPIAADAIGEDLRKQLDELRKDLAANPLQIPVVVGGGDTANLRRAALKLGSR